MNSDTIYALSTPPGVGALAVIRLSGPGVRDVMRAFGIRSDLSPRVATYTPLLSPTDQRVLDHAVVTFFEHPRSFTGEDCAELSVHGGRAVVDGVMRVLSRLPGIRLAEPGEFTKRAFLNNKLDLTEAEAVADLIHAETALQRDQALAQLAGSLKDLYDDWRTVLIKSAAYLEAHLDFPDEDLPNDLLDRLRPALQTLKAELDSHLNDGGRGERLRDGVRVVIVGEPNAGKSSFLNLVAKREVAIVSEHAGTTRDVIDVHLDLGGAPVILSDTAGLRDQQRRDPQAAVEAEGIKRALTRAQEADLLLVLVDATLGGSVSPSVRDFVTPERSMVVLTKTDLVSRGTILPPSVLGVPAFCVSSKTGQGLDELMQVLTERVHHLLDGVGQAPLTRARHRAHLDECVQAIDQVLSTPLPPELMAEELRTAIQAIGRITGRVDVEDFLDVIFREFCIGK